MKRKLLKAALCLCSLLCLSGCAKHNSQGEESLNLQDKTETSKQTDFTKPEQNPAAAAENTEDSPSSETQRESAPLETSTASSASQTYFTLPTVTTPSPEQQGGQGGQEFAETPLPQYFTYRFQEDAVSMRLAGGNYQTIFYDFSEALLHDVNSQYYLEDVNFDGFLDLAIPCQFQEDQVTYAVFLWQSGTSYYEETPLLLPNPEIDPKKQEIKCTERMGTEIAVCTVYGLIDGKLQAIRRVQADYSALTLSSEDLLHAEKQAQNFNSIEELEAAFQAAQ